MKRKYYLIDTENVGDRWLSLPEKAGKKDRIIAFYTEYHSNLLEKYLVKQVHNPKILWLECAAGNNALDYQLIGVLSFLIAKHPKASFCIYSNDTDYKETVDFWKIRGIDVSTKGFALTEKKKKEKKKNKQMGKKKPEEKKKPESQKKEEEKKKPELTKEEKKKLALTKKQEEKKKLTLAKKQEETGKLERKQQTGSLLPGNGQAADEKPMAGQPAQKATALTAEHLDHRQLTKKQLAEEIARSIPTSDLSSWYCAAISILGMEYGRVWYLNFKKNAQLRGKYSEYYNGNKQFRGINLIAAALHANGLDIGGAKEAYQIICSHSEADLNGIKQAFDKAFQKELRQGYYKSVKPLVKVIKKVA